MKDYAFELQLMKAKKERLEMEIRVIGWKMKALEDELKKVLEQWAEGERNCWQPPLTETEKHE